MRLAEADELATDPRFATNSLRVRNRDVLYALMPAYMESRTTAEWVDGLAERGVPCSPVKNIKEVFEDPQVQHRGMRIEMPHPQSSSSTVPLIGNPIKMSATPVSYRQAPPVVGQHTDEILKELLGLSGGDLDDLRNRTIIG